MAIYEPPNNYFNNINFNTDFYTIPNDELNGISSSYANSHYLQISAGTAPKSSSISTYFGGGVSIGYSNNPLYIPSAGYLSCQNIITQFNIAGNNIYTDNNFYEANVPLSTKYQSNLSVSKFILSKQYPPASLTSDSTLFSAQPYGNGTYITSSSSISTGKEPYKAFLYPLSLNTLYWSSFAGYYNTGPGNYIGGTLTDVLNPVSSIYGEWFQIRLPISTSLILKSYTLSGLTTGIYTQNPTAWKLVASQNGSTWYIIDSRSGVSWSSSVSGVYTFTPNEPTYETNDWSYFRLIITNTNGAALASVQQIQMNFYSSTDINANAITTGGIAIGSNASNYLIYPYTLAVVGDTALIGNVACNKLGVGISSPSYGLDVVSLNGCRIQSTTASAGYIVLQGASTSSATGSINFYDGFGGSNGSIGGALVNGSYINMNTVFGITSGYSINGNLLTSGICGISTTSFNTNASFDVGGTTTSTKYSFLNGLRISGRDPNTIWQDISTSNINITTSGTSQYIGFNIGNGSLIGLVNSSGIQMASGKGIGIGTSPNTNTGITYAATAGATAAINVIGSNGSINLNNNGIRFAYASTNGIYALNATINDCIFVNSNNRFLFNPSASAYASIIMSSASSGTTSFINTSTGVAGVNIYGTGGISANTVNATNGISTGGSLTISGGTPNLSGNYTAAAGSLTANNVTGVPVGYIYWGGGNGTAVAAYSCPSGTAYSLKADNAILANGFISTSDKRVKRDIKSIENSLEIINKIEPKNYNMIETAENRYGFIAQEVEEILPNAVILSNDFIPNIFDYGTYDDKIITFDNKNNLEIVEGDEIKINYQSCRVDEVIDKNSFRIHKKLEVDENNKVFIMGTKVKDFKCINYDMITSINTASIKELHKIILKQQEQINLLISKLS